MKSEICALLIGNNLAHGQFMNGYFVVKLLHHIHFEIKKTWLQSNNLNKFELNKFVYYDRTFLSCCILQLYFSSTFLLLMQSLGKQFK